MSKKDIRKTEVSALGSIIVDCALYDAEKTIAELRERVGTLESLLARAGSTICDIASTGSDYQLIEEIDAILPKPPTAQ